jgi:hypothetical protein
LGDLSLRARLTLLVAGAILPLATIAGFTAYRLSEVHNEASAARLLHLSRSLLNTIEARIDTVIGAAEALSVSQELQTGNLEAFRRHVAAFLKSFMPSASLVLSDAEENQLVNTADPVPLLRRKNISPEVLEAHREVFTTGKPVVSRLFVGQVINRPAISVNVPVMRGENVIYNIGVPLTAQFLSQF